MLIASYCHSLPQNLIILISYNFINHYMIICLIVHTCHIKVIFSGLHHLLNERIDLLGRNWIILSMYECILIDTNMLLVCHGSLLLAHNILCRIFCFCRVRDQCSFELLLFFHFIKVSQLTFQFFHDLKQ